MYVNVLLKDFCNYSSYIKGYSPDTIRRYKFSVNFFCKQFDIEKIKEVTDDKVYNFFFNGRVERKWSPNSFVTYHKSLLVFFRWCKNKGYLKNNPAENIEMPKQQKKIPNRLTRQQAEELLEKIYNYPYHYKFLRSRNRAIFATFLLAGLRKNELLNLKFTDIDIENKSLFVRLGKGGKDRIIPICGKLIEYLEEYVKERKRLNKTCVEYFSSLNRNMGFTESGMKHLVEFAKRVTKLNFSVHKLRHSFATLMLEGGCDIFSLSRMMGHSDIKTTTIYLATTTEHLKEQILKHPLN